MRSCPYALDLSYVSGRVSAWQPKSQSMLINQRSPNSGRDGRQQRGSCCRTALRPDYLKKNAEAGSAEPRLAWLGLA